LSIIPTETWNRKIFEIIFSRTKHRFLMNRRSYDIMFRYMMMILLIVLNEAWHNVTLGDIFFRFYNALRKMIFTPKKKNTHTSSLR
jgi:hypothetical protein